MVRKFLWLWLFFPSVQRQTPKKEPIVVQFNTLTRSARKRQQGEMMRDVESEINLN